MVSHFFPTACHALTRSKLQSVNTLHSSHSGYHIILSCGMVEEPRHVPSGVCIDVHQAIQPEEIIESKRFLLKRWVSETCSVGADTWVSREGQLTVISSLHMDSNSLMTSPTYSRRVVSSHSVDERAGRLLI